MPSRVFTIDELNDHEVAWGESDTVLINESIDSGRWTEYFHTVFRADDDQKLYYVNTARGLTEYQQDGMGPEDHFPEMDWQTKTVECPEVELYETTVVVTKWRKV